MMMKLSKSSPKILLTQNQFRSAAFKTLTPLHRKYITSFEMSISSGRVISLQVDRLAAGMASVAAATGKIQPS